MKDDLVRIDVGGERVEIDADVVYHPPSYEFVSHGGVALALVLVAKERLDLKLRRDLPDEVLALTGDQGTVTVRWGPHKVKLGPASVQVHNDAVIAIQQR